MNTKELRPERYFSGFQTIRFYTEFIILYSAPFSATYIWYHGMSALKEQNMNA
jgi:hypothetical protein